MSASDPDLSAGHKEKRERWCVARLATAGWKFVQQETEQRFKSRAAAVATRFGNLQLVSCLTAASKADLKDLWLHRNLQSC